MAKGYFYVFYDPEDGFISGKASDVARDMAAKGAFRPAGWVEIAVWAAVSLFVSRELSGYLNFAGAAAIVLWPVIAVLFYAVSRGILFLSAWTASRKNAQNPEVRQSLRQYIWFGEGSMYTESEDSRLDISYKRIRSVECEEDRFILNMSTGKRIILEKKHFLEGKPEKFEAFIRKKIEEGTFLELEEGAPRARVLESEEGIYRLYQAAEWNRLKSGREKYPFSMYLIVFLCVSAGFTFINISLKEAALPFAVYAAIEAALAGVCAAHYFIKNRQARSEKSLRKAAGREWKMLRGKADGLEKELVFFKKGFKVRTEEYTTSYNYENVNTVIASEDSMVIAGDGFSFVAMAGTKTADYPEIKRLIEGGKKIHIEEMTQNNQ